jgi:arginyl-tRNA synthetase
MADIREKLSEDISVAVANLWGENIVPEIGIPDDFEHGDLTTNLPFKLAGVLRKPPKAIASEIASVVVLPLGIASAEPAGAGYINFKYDNNYLYDMLAEIITHPERFGKGEKSHDCKVQIEFVSANPTGPLNVVSARAAAVGSSLIKIMRHAGIDVAGEYYINDTGGQIRNLEASFIARIRQGAGLEWEIPPRDGYHGEYLADLAAIYADRFPKEHERLVETWNNGREADIAHAANWIVEELKRLIKADLEEFNTHIDTYFSEREFRATGKVEETIERLRTQGDLLDEDGAVWFDATKYDPDEKPFVLIKSDGEYAYAAVDIAYHHKKFERGFDFCYDIWGPDHHGHVGRMKAAMRALGHDSKFDVLILQQVNLLEEGEKVRMSKRAGNLITLRELIEDVGVDVARYFFLARRMEAHLDFDLDLARKESDENPVFYIQYAHARINSILKFAENQGIDPESTGRHELAELTEPEALLLARKLAVWPSVVQKAAAEKSPHEVCFYLLELAQMFHPFYNKHRVVGPDEKKTLARVALCRALKEAIALGLSLLGINAPENM